MLGTYDYKKWYKEESDDEEELDDLPSLSPITR